MSNSNEGLLFYKWSVKGRLVIIPGLAGRRTLVRLHIRLLERAAKIGGKLKEYNLATDYTD